MNPVQHHSTNAELGPPRDSEPGKIQPLPITRVTYDDGLPTVRSFWMPSADERLAIAGGALIRLEVIGHTHPPLFVGVDGVDRV